MINRLPTIGICSYVSGFADDMRGTCARCSAVIYFRPHTAKLVTAENRVCFKCAIAIGNECGGLKFEMDPETYAELELLLRPAAGKQPS